MIMSTISGIFAVAKAIPVIRDSIDKIYMLWVSTKVEDIDEQYRESDQKRKILMQQIKGATDDETRKTLSIILADSTR